MILWILVNSLFLHLLSPLSTLQHKVECLEVLWVVVTGRGQVCITKYLSCWESLGAVTSFNWAFFQLLESVMAPVTTGSLHMLCLSAWMYTLGWPGGAQTTSPGPLNQDLRVGSRHQWLLMFPGGFKEHPSLRTPFPAFCFSACLPAYVTPALLCLPCLASPSSETHFLAFPCPSPKSYPSWCLHLPPENCYHGS